MVLHIHSEAFYDFFSHLIKGQYNSTGVLYSAVELYSGFLAVKLLSLRVAVDS